MKYQKEAAFIGDNIKKQISYSGKSAAEVAREMGLHENVLYNYTRGRSAPSGAIIRPLCMVLDCTYEEILGPLE